MNIAHRLDRVKRTEDVILNENISFEGLLLSQNTLDGLKICGFQKPSPIQLRAIPLGKCGFDLILEAKSGTGKTAVFGIIALEMINLDIGCQTLILAPTREIASQIAQVLTAIGSNFQGLKIEIVMGGTDYKDDVQRLNGNKFQILVGSPGRMKHLIKENVFPTDAIRLIVLDEADRLMEDSFAKDINYIFSKLPHRKQVIASSATYTPQIKDFLSNFMRSASHVRPDLSNVLLGLSQYFLVVALHHNAVRQNKIIFDELLRLISEIPFKQCLVFTNHQIVAKSLCKSLTENGWPVRFLSGMQSQMERIDSLYALKTFSCRILVATDLAARGIDAENVDLVINFDPPYDLPTYLHRIGRAGRFGSKGTAITILPAGVIEENFQSLLKEMGAPLVHPLIDYHLRKSKSDIDLRKKYFIEYQEEKLKNDTSNLTCSSSDRSKPVKSFDDILVSCDQFNDLSKNDSIDCHTGKSKSEIDSSEKDLTDCVIGKSKIDIGSSKKVLTDYQEEKSKNVTSNLTFSNSNKNETIESFDDILMSRDQFINSSKNDLIECHTGKSKSEIDSRKKYFIDYREEESKNDASNLTCSSLDRSKTIESFDDILMSRDQFNVSSENDLIDCHTGKSRSEIASSEKDLNDFVVGKSKIDIDSSKKVLTNYREEKYKKDASNLTCSSSDRSKTIESFDDVLMFRDQFNNSSINYSIDCHTGKLKEDIDSSKTVLTDYQEEKSKNFTSNLTFSISNRNETPESFDDILMSRDPFKAECSRGFLETCGSLSDPYYKCSDRDNPIESEAIRHVDYNTSNFISTKNDLILNRNISQTSNLNDQHNCEDKFYQQLKNRCTVKRNLKSTKCLEIKRIPKTESYVECSSKKKNIGFYKKVVSDGVQPDPVTSDLANRNDDYPHNIPMAKKLNHIPRNLGNNFSIDDYNDFKLKLSSITRQIQSFIYIDTLLLLNH